MENQKKQWSRRQFITISAAGVAGAAVLPGLVSCATKGEGIKLGFIGLGRQSMFLLNGFMQIPGVEAVAGCDVYGIKRQRFEKRVNEFYAKAKILMQL